MEHGSLLKHLHIKNFAIIEEIDISFNEGMTVFTGETGAGKSIMVGALGLILGDRADSSVIRAGCEHTEITATFELSNISELATILTEQHIDFQEELILRRIVSKNGRARAYANGTTVPMQLLRTLGELIADIHGQHAHQSLLKIKVQMDILDEFGNYPEIIDKVASVWKTWHEAELELQTLSSGNDHNAQLALLRYQVDELENFKPEPSEFSRIEAEYKRLSNMSHLIEVCQQTLQQMTDDEQSIYHRINHHLNALQNIQQLDKSLSSIVDLLTSASIQITEASVDLRHHAEKLEMDPERLSIIEQRLNTFQDIARKYNIQPNLLAEYLQSLQDELDKSENSEAHIKQLQELQQLAFEEYHQAADQLHQCRQQAADKLSKDVSDKLKILGIPGGQLSIKVSHLKEGTLSKHGLDKIEYLVSLNPGQPLQALTKVASGGELSRVSLAIQVIGLRDKGVPIMIFDEVDSGIGGGIAEIIGEMLHSLADKRQVFCVTHLAQIAAQGDDHIQVRKTSNTRITLTEVNELQYEQRIEEIARMLGGFKITEHTRAHAREMLDNS